ncbi:glutaredoxin family protein [Nocardia rhizosphaerae]|uniref:Glutaredoxin family protein n=1 Tax=Nocardia rhizosphaerae TaxID=1691571 RepID=A0ABV8LF09_9NOCA
MYTQPDCQPCKATKRTLDKLGAEYTLIDVTEEPDAIDAIRALGYQQTPVVVVGDEHWSGHRPEQLRWAANATNP